MASESCNVCHGTGRAFDLQALHPGLQTIPDVEASIDDASIEATEGSVKLTIDFTVKDPDGNYIPNLAAVGSNNRFLYLRFAVSELQPEDNGLPGGDDPMWVNYTTRDGPPATPTPQPPIQGNLVDNVDGTYSYTFWTNLASKYNGGWTHRVLLMVFGTIVEQAKNVTYDFVPEPDGEAATRNIVTNQACNNCHNRLGSPLSAASFHGGSRYTIEACTVCHSSTLGGGDFEFAPMVHKIHSAQEVGDVDFTEVTYPQSLANCTTCHQGDPNGDFWKTVQNAKTCFNGCHGVPDGVPAGHSPTMTQACGQCHNGGFAPLLEEIVPEAHATENSTPHNPQLPPGLVNLEYVLDNVTVESGQTLVQFHICSSTDNEYFAPPLKGPCADPNHTLIEANTYPPTGFTNATSPSFLVLYATSQDGVETPADYNNDKYNNGTGTPPGGGQPRTVSLSSLAGTLTGTSAKYTATFPPVAAFPAGATMRAVALQGYYTQAKGTGNPPEPEANTARHTRSVVKAVSGDAVRRTVVSEAKCLKCHEILELHGGNRVNNPQVCVGCHNPNLSSSGRGSNPLAILNNPNASAEAKEATQQTVDTYGTDPLEYPEATNNFKDLVHGIHAAAKRSTPYEFVRNRGNSGVFSFDWSEVTFPGILSDCLTCHITPPANQPQTYTTNLPEGVLMSTDVTTNGNISTPADVNTSRASMPNGADLVITPITSACYKCHDTGPAASHFGKMGGVVDGERSIALGE